MERFDMSWKFRRRSRHNCWRYVWFYCGGVVVLIVLANVLIMQRNFATLEGDNFIDTSGMINMISNRGLNLNHKNNNDLLVRKTDKSREHYNVFASKLRRLMEIMETSLENTVSYGSTENVIPMEAYFSERLLDCQDISSISNRTYLASGWTKAVYKGVYKGTPVAIKTVDPKGQEVTTCMETGRSSKACYLKAAKKIVKEIVVLQALGGENTLKVLGFCLPRSPDDDLWVAMVTELGESVDLIKLLQMSWEDRLRVCLDITRIMEFMRTTPYGSMAMNDFRRQQFVLVDGRLKLSDVDDSGFDDPRCLADADCTVTFSSYNFSQGTKCVHGRCPLYNVKRNVFNAGRHFTTFLLPHGAPVMLRPIIDKVIDGYTNLTMSTKQLLSSLEKIVRLYQTGWYTNRSRPEDYTTGYRELRARDLPGRYDYRCRFSLSGLGCTVSVLDQREAEDVCNMDDDCRGFVMSPQRTWTGRRLVHLKSGVRNPSYSPTTSLFLRPG